ncbi:hypothetical protein Kisp02_41230 [Kineosporia sp. NBRC 101731]|nr:hypothetical protein Kisp02_41230 [Kineosporia sp. NBRC 101731]
MQDARGDSSLHGRPPFCGSVRTRELKPKRSLTDGQSSPAGHHRGEAMAKKKDTKGKKKDAKAKKGKKGKKKSGKKK